VGMFLETVESLLDSLLHSVIVAIG
jgi:hypothetical protein